MQTWNTVSPYMIPSTLRLRFIALLSMLSVYISKVLNLIPPYLFKLAVDQLTQNAITGASDVPITLLLYFILTRVLSRFISGLQSYMYGHVSANNVTRFSILLFEQLQRLSLAYHLNARLVR